jgi:HK97 family phage prohead protease
MTTRVRDFDDDEHDGFAPLRARIMAAHESGDVELLTQLQTEYRNRPLPGRSIVRVVNSRGSTASTPAPPKPPPVQRASDHDPERVLTGYVLRWGPVPTATRDGESFTCDVQPDAIRAWLASTDPRSIPVHLNHGGLEVGRWLSFDADEFGLWGTCVIDDEPAGDLVLEGVDRGELRAFSLAFGSIGDEDEDVEIAEAGPATDAADEGAVIASIGGRQPLWMRRQSALERDELMRRTFGFD